MTEVLDRPQTANLPAKSNGSVPVNYKAPVGSSMTLKKLLEASKQQIADVLPKHLTPDRIVRVALIAVNKTPKLLDCTMESVLQAVLQAAALGLDPGGALGSAYLVPYKNTCTLIPGYRGLIDLARRSGEIESISADVVYKHDKFVYRKGSDPVLIHEPDLFAEQKDEDIIGAYMVAQLKDGGKHIEFMNRQQIERIRNGSKSAFDYNGKPIGPWRDHFSEMCRKTVVRRGCKYLPISSERFASALDLDNEVDGSTDIAGIPTIEQGQSRTQALLQKLTSRPVSEGQEFQPDPQAVAQAEAEAAQQQATDVQTEAARQLREHEFGVPEDNPEPDTSGADAEPPSEPAAREMTPNEKWWAEIFDARDAAEIGDTERFRSAVLNWAMRAGVKGKEHKASAQQMKELLSAIAEKSGKFAFAAQ